MHLPMLLSFLVDSIRREAKNRKLKKVGDIFDYLLSYSAFLRALLGAFKVPCDILEHKYCIIHMRE